MCTIMDLHIMKIILTIVATHLFMSTQCYANDVSVNTTHGLVKGVSTYESGTKVDKYLGIPYAMPPVGDLRFKDPVPRKTWKNTWNATEFTPFCAMVGLEISEEMKMSEDCLYLNVFVPEVFGGPIDGLPVVVLLSSLPVELRPSGKLPVTESMMRDGSILAAVESVIVVTVNFRRDMFGFLATTDSETAGNYALKDQNMALKWVKDNIAHFKGNPNQITLGGLVGGATYVALHMVSPASKGLCQRAFMTGIVSPYSDASRKHYPGGGPAGLFAEELAHYVNCPAGNGFTDEETMMSCLREVTTEKLINASISLYEEKYKNQTAGYWMFIDRVDGSFIPADVTTLWQQGSHDNVPLLVGGGPVPVDSDFGVVNEITEMEYKTEILRLVSSMPWEIPSQNNSYYQPLAEAAMYVYSDWTNGGRKMAQQIIKMEGDKKEAGQIKMLSVFTDNENSNSSEKAAVYKYIFNYKSSNSRTPGVPMGEDVLYLLGEPRNSGRWTVQDRQVSQLMMKFYGNFIYYGNPTYGSGVSWWPVFDSTDQTYLEVNREGRTDIKQNYRKDKMSFWNQLRPMMLSRIEDIVVDVRQYPDLYNAYVDPQRITESEDKTKEENGTESQNPKNDTSIADGDDNDDDDDDDMHKYFLATWILAGVGIVLAICIVVLICITYKAKAEVYTFEATKL